jgi:DNA-binding response OmpR family regulator
MPHRRIISRRRSTGLVADINADQLVSVRAVQGGRQARVLLVEDDDVLRHVTARGLLEEGFEVDQAVDGEDALARFDPELHDVLVLDLMLPKASGMTVLRRVRETSATRVVLLSGFSDDASRVVALEMGADDFVTKPVGPRELALRLRNVLGRGRVSDEEVLTFGALEIWPRRRLATVDGTALDLTGKEYELLECFARSPGRVFSRAALLQAVWGSNLGWQSPNTVTEHVYRLRRKLEADPTRPRWIHTIRGAGYCFDG